MNYENDVLSQKWHNARVNFIITWQTSVLYETPLPLTTSLNDVFDTSIFCCSLKRIILQQSVGIFAISGLIRCTVRFPPAFILFAFICSSSNCRVMPQGPHTNGMHLLFSLPGSGFNWMTRYHGKYAWKSYFPRATLHLVRSICLGGQIIFGIKSPSLKLEADSIHVGFVAVPRLNFNVT